MSSITEEAKTSQEEVSVPIEGMTCASCAARIEKKLNKVDGVTAITTTVPLALQGSTLHGAAVDVPRRVGARAARPRRPECRARSGARSDVSQSGDRPRRAAAREPSPRQPAIQRLAGHFRSQDPAHRDQLFDIDAGGKTLALAEKRQILEHHIAGGARRERAAAEAAERAVEKIRGLTQEIRIEKGEVYNGKIVSIMPYGAFVEIMPGKDGLVHISELSEDPSIRVARVEDVINLGDEITVMVTEVAPNGKVSLSRRAALTGELPDSKPERTDRPPRRDNDRDRGPRRDDRGPAPRGDRDAGPARTFEGRPRGDFQGRPGDSVRRDRPPGDND